ncbi:MAG: cytochrome c3 family protein [Deltaproteobacteria bacterium]|nr:cytochrome c3 family protein [Deltaproteobacteria bacterium]
MHKIQTLALVVAVVMIVGIGWVTADEAEDTMCIPMGSISLEAPEGAETQRSEVEFPHSVHFDFNCKRCHHTWDAESAILSCTTAGCHDLTAVPEGGLKSGEAVRYYKSAFHGTCIGCHKEIKAHNRELEKSMATLREPLQPSGPTGCIGCHPKE